MSPGKDRHRLLQNDRARVGPLVHEVHRAAGLLLPRLDCPTLRVETRELRKQRRMDVEDPAAKTADELRRENPHVSREADEIRPRAIENREHLPLPVAAARHRLPVHGVGRQAPGARPSEARRTPRRRRSRPRSRRPGSGPPSTASAIASKLVPRPDSRTARRRRGVIGGKGARPRRAAQAGSGT